MVRDGAVKVDPDSSSALDWPKRDTSPPLNVEAIKIKHSGSYNVTFLLFVTRAVGEHAWTNQGFFGPATEQHQLFHCHHLVPIET